MKKNIFAGIILMLVMLMTISACTAFSIKNYFPDRRDDFELLPENANFYLWADVKKSRSMLDEVLKMFKMTNKNYPIFLDKSRSIACAYYQNNPERKYLAVFKGSNYPKGVANMAFGLDIAWKKKKSETGFPYWRSEKSKISLSLHKNIAFISDGDPFFKGRGTILGDTFILFSADSAISLWSPTSKPLRDIIEKIEIPINLPVNEIFINFYPVQTDWQITIRLECSSVSAAKAATSMLNIARNSILSGNIRIDKRYAPFISLLIANEPFSEGAGVILRTGELSTADIIKMVTYSK